MECIHHFAFHFFPFLLCGWIEFHALVSFNKSPASGGRRAF
jgi:hypothetical protein